MLNRASSLTDSLRTDLSAVAKAITGSHCNGYLFFRPRGRLRLRSAGCHGGIPSSRGADPPGTHRPRHARALAVPQCLRLLPEQDRHLTNGLAVPTIDSTVDARRGYSVDVPILMSPSTRERIRRMFIALPSLPDRHPAARLRADCLFFDFARTATRASTSSTPRRAWVSRRVSLVMTNRKFAARSMAWISKTT